MKKYLILMIFVVIIFLLLYVCFVEEERVLILIIFEVVQFVIDFKSDVGICDIVIVINVDYWMVWFDKDWCLVVVNESILMVNVFGYDGKEIREVVIKVIVDGLVEIVNVC